MTEARQTVLPTDPRLARFRCTACGNCCRIAGRVALRIGEEARMAAHLGMTPYDFTGRYTRLSAHRGALELVDGPDGACVFLDGQGRCRVYDARPEQCRGFPLRWRYAGAEDVCPPLRECLEKAE